MVNIEGKVYWRFLNNIRTKVGEDWHRGSEETIRVLDDCILKIKVPVQNNTNDLRGDMSTFFRNRTTRS
jgi:hypothetical protein